ncbi:MAG: OmpA family protein [Thermoanaerobaculia bacterium]
MRIRSLFAVALLSLFALPLLAAPDREGCKDHPLFNRMPGFFIYRCETKEFDSVPFFIGPGKETKAEGRVFSVQYYLNEGATTPSRVQIVRNYENAVRKLGGSTLHSIDDAQYFMRLARDGKEFSIILDAYNASQPSLTIIEKEAMRQDIVASAEVLSGDIRTTGHAAVYGIYFDTNSAEIKPQSKPALDEIGKLLKNNAALKLLVVGHTDSTGLFDANIRLSQARAESVVKALTTQYGIPATRLKPHGVGPSAPVESNDTDHGRGKNRRVELVKM